MIKKLLDKLEEEGKREPTGPENLITGILLAIFLIAWALVGPPNNP